jgi:hypothetical protein
VQTHEIRQRFPPFKPYLLGQATPPELAGRDGA